MPLQPRSWSRPNADALFSLRAFNERAKEVIKHPSNRHLLSALDDGELVLDIGHFQSSTGKMTTLATMGRIGDIVVDGSNISRNHCSFEINLDTGIIMFSDNSSNKSSQVFGKRAYKFVEGHPRQVVVQKDINPIIGIGGTHQSEYMFALIWQSNDYELRKRIQHRQSTDLKENPKFTNTVREGSLLDIPAAPYCQAISGSIPRSPTIRFAQLSYLGQGAYGKVYKAVDIDTGRLMAVKKIIPHPQDASEGLTLAQREVDILSTISHPHVVEYFSSDGWGTSNIRIFMALKDGNVRDLVVEENAEAPLDIEQLGRDVMHHMLQALDFLASKNIIHRDVKPENILYDIREGNFHFVLGDFGLSRHAELAGTVCGTRHFQAPEVNQSGMQTAKMDIWSLFVTLLWIWNVRGFRRFCHSRVRENELRAQIRNVSGLVRLKDFREMAKVNYQERASAAQILLKCWNGVGLTTPLQVITPLPRAANDLKREGPLIKNPRNVGESLISLLASTPSPKPRARTARERSAIRDAARTLSGRVQKSRRCEPAKRSMKSTP